VGFWLVNTIAICIKPTNGAVSSFGEYGLPCGLRDSLCTLQWFHSVRENLLHHCNTRYRWVVNPCLAGTLTLLKAPSFAWRTNVSGSAAALLSGRLEPLRIEATFRVASIPCSSKPAEGVVGDMGNASGVSGWTETGEASGIEW
jgi:hypothetical protein